MLPGPTTADASVNTPATFTLMSGSLSISVPTGPVDLGSAATTASSLSGQLGTVTVTDGRGLLVATWSATVSSTDFTTGTATTHETVTKSNIAYSAGAATSTTGIGVFTPGVLANLSSAGTAGAWTVGVGNNSASWNPTINVTIPAGSVTGTYSGTITHSVA